MIFTALPKMAHFLKRSEGDHRLTISTVACPPSVLDAPTMEDAYAAIEAVEEPVLRVF